MRTLLLFITSSFLQIATSSGGTAIYEFEAVVTNSQAGLWAYNAGPAGTRSDEALTDSSFAQVGETISGQIRIDEDRLSFEVTQAGGEFAYLPGLRTSRLVLSQIPEVEETPAYDPVLQYQLTSANTDLDWILQRDRNDTIGTPGSYKTTNDIYSSQIEVFNNLSTPISGVEFAIMDDSPIGSPSGGTIATRPTLSIPVGDSIQITAVDSFFESQSSGGGGSSDERNIRELTIQFSDSTNSAFDSSDSLPPLSLDLFDSAQLVYFRDFDFDGGGRTRSWEHLSATITSLTLTQNLATLSVHAPPVNEGLVGYPVTFSLENPTQARQSFSFHLEDGVSNFPSNRYVARVSEDFLPWDNGSISFEPGESTKTIVFTMLDDAIREPDENFSLVLSDLDTLSTPLLRVPLTILNDDTVLDDYGSQFGLSLEQRSIDSDDDNDGIGLLLEYAFNLDPTSPEASDYAPGQNYSNEEEPFGLPVLLVEEDSIRYLFLRRIDSYPNATSPNLDYIAEVSSDGLNFVPVEPSQVTYLTSHWQEVEITLSSFSTTDPHKAFIRVRVVDNEQNKDGS